jgi:hypothetical protein
VGQDKRNVEVVASMARAYEAGPSRSNVAYSAAGRGENPVFNSKRKRTAWG